jgi:hypothetical protein
MKNSPFLMAIFTIVVIVIAVAVLVEGQHKPQKPFQIQTYGPVWTGTAFTCTSDSDFLIHGMVRALNGGQLAVGISGFGTQSLYSFDVGKLYSFTVGSPGNHTMVITRTNTVTGFFTLETAPDAKASCTQT